MQKVYERIETIIHTLHVSEMGVVELVPSGQGLQVVFAEDVPNGQAIHDLMK